MKKLALTIGLAAAVMWSPVSARANGGCYYSSCGSAWPWVAFGLGLATVATVSSLAYEARQPAYVYSYPPAYTTYTTYTTAPATVTAPAVSKSVPAAPETPAPAATVAYTEPTPWVPSSPGAGHWVPDPTPYRYTPSAAVVRTKPAAPPASPAPQTVMHVCTYQAADGVTVYRVQR